jgi:hypothetical protein
MPAVTGGQFQRRRIAYAIVIGHGWKAVYERDAEQAQ